MAGIGQALLEAELAEPELLPYVLGRNEQAMVHSAAAYTRMKDRLQTWAVSTSVGPGATNMVTGAALATINRLPVLLLPADTFADRAASPLLQELELPDSGDVTVNDCFRPVSRYFDRVWRPEQLPSAMLAAMRVLTDPAETGAVTVCFPQDVQAQAHDWPVGALREAGVARRPAPARAGRRWRGPRRRSAPRDARWSSPAAASTTAARPTPSRRSARPPASPSARARPARARCCSITRSASGAIGSTGTTAANAIARDADVVIGIGTRYSDFTTASRTAFQADGVRFVNINVAGLDAVKHSGIGVVADARETLERAHRRHWTGTAVDAGYEAEYQRLDAEWERDGLPRATRTRRPAACSPRTR